jgi:outer membrane protein assembly factor BamA
VFVDCSRACAGRAILGAIVAWLAVSSSAARAEEGSEQPAEQSSQQSADEDAPKARTGTVALPGIFYTPDTGLTGYLGVLRYFQSGPNTKPSKLAGNIAANTEKDITVELLPELWFGDDDYTVSATTLLAWRSDAFFGIGNDTRNSDHESYDQFIASARIRALRKLRPSLFVGGAYEIRHVGIRGVDPDGQLATGTLEGSDGGLLSGIGLIARLDSRDNSFFPRSGAYVQVSPRWYSHLIGSDHTYMRLHADARYFTQLFNEQVVAFHADVDLREGDPPFDHMSNAGGPALLRGMLTGRFRDMVFVGAQVEYRTHVWRRFGAVAFVAAGAVAPSVSKLELGTMHYAGGAGVRFAIKPKDQLNLRLDLAISDVDTGVYLNILEAF